MTKAYLIKLAGMGDHQWTLLNQEDWDFLKACINWSRETPIPSPPERMISGVMECFNIDQDAAKASLALDPHSATAENDIALSIPGSLFDGERFCDHEASIQKLNAFIAKHNLDLEESYTGYIY